MDLAEIDPVSPVSFEATSQLLAMGEEIDVFHVQQLRVGYQANIAGGVDDVDLLSVGVGLC